MSILSDKKVSRDLVLSWKARMREHCFIVQDGRLGRSLITGFWVAVLVLIVTVFLQVFSVIAVDSDGILNIATISTTVFGVGLATKSLAEGFIIPRDGVVLSNSPSSEDLVRRHTMRRWYVVMSVLLVAPVIIASTLYSKSSYPMLDCFLVVGFSYMVSLGLAHIVNVNMTVVLPVIGASLFFFNDSVFIGSLISKLLPTSWPFYSVENQQVLEPNLWLLSLSALLGIYGMWRMIQLVRTWIFTRNIYDYDFYFSQHTELARAVVEVDEVTRDKSGWLDLLLAKILTPAQQSLADIYSDDSLTKKVKIVLCLLGLGIALYYLPDFVLLSEEWLASTMTLSNIALIIGIYHCIPFKMASDSSFEKTGLGIDAVVSQSAMFPVRVADLILLNIKSALVVGIFTVPLMMTLLYFCSFLELENWGHTFEETIAIHILVMLNAVILKLRYGSEFQLDLFGADVCRFGFWLIYTVFIVGSFMLLQSFLHDAEGGGIFLKLSVLVTLALSALALTIIDYKNMKLDKLYRVKS